MGRIGADLKNKKSVCFGLIGQIRVREIITHQRGHNTGKRKMDYEIIICFETHVELKTATKLFCGCAVKGDQPPNSQVCPVCTGQPGALPVLNRRAVEFCVRTGLALNCSINRHSRFARKNYFYPDLPKGYQISQYERPFCENGVLEIVGDDGKPYPVGIKRIHLEEDAGKLMHVAGAKDAPGHSLVDFNRACVPLLEIVGDHERNPLRSVKEARSYLEKLRQILQYIDVSDCSMEQGQFRCDVNISLRPKGVRTFGNRTEIKNMSSFKFITEALEYEIKRQLEILEGGRENPQETRLFDESQKVTLLMRSKEDAPDYRYFPDPDLVEVEIFDEEIDRIRASLPELPDHRVQRLIAEYHLPQNEVLVLTKDRAVADYFSAAATHCRDSRKLVYWIIQALFQLLNEAGQSIAECKIPPKHLAELINLISDGGITEKIGQDVLAEMFTSGEPPEKIIAAKNLKPIQDSNVLAEKLDEIIAQNPEVVAKIRQGETKLVNFIVGQVMKATRGQANPQILNELVRDRLLQD